MKRFRIQADGVWETVSYYDSFYALLKCGSNHITLFYVG